jgi:Tfp pilus assembly protein PilN
VIQFNLLPDVKKQYIKAKRTKRLIMSVSFLSAACALFIVGVLLSVQLAQSKNINDLTNDISAGVGELESIGNLNEILTIQRQLESLPALHESKSESSRIFDYLVQLTPSDVKISSVQLNTEEGTITIEGSAPSLASVNRYTDTLRFARYTADTKINNEQGSEAEDANETEELLAFSNVSTELSRNEERSSYEIRASFDPILFDNTKTIVLIIPNTVTTRSTQGKPTISNDDSNPLFESGGEIN